METITLTHENLEKEHICCAISSHDDIQVRTKKEWLKEQFDQGLIFTKMNIRGKCFIEYMPLENAWVPLLGDNLMYINCLWVSGKFQGQGYAKELLEGCINKSQELGRDGIVILSSVKKTPFLMDYGFLEKHGFRTVDTWHDYVLMLYPINQVSVLPKFKNNECQEDGLVLYYTDQCPFNAKYVHILKDHCESLNINLKLIHISNKEEAQKAPTPLTTYSLFYNQQFVTREVLSHKKFDKIWSEIHG